jgi:hypothetical protein
LSAALAALPLAELAEGAALAPTQQAATPYVQYLLLRGVVDKVAEALKIIQPEFGVYKRAGSRARCLGRRMEGFLG